jgi:hypothetical protein
MLTGAWPSVQIDPVQRLRVLAAAVRGPMYGEGLMEADLGAVWSIVSDLEHSLPDLILDVRSFEIESAEGERLTGLAIGRLGQRARFAVRLSSGWCLMQSRFVVGALAARQEAAGTRFAVMAGLRIPGAALMHPLLTPIGRRAGARTVHRLRSLVEATNSG